MTGARAGGRTGSPRFPRPPETHCATPGTWLYQKHGNGCEINMQKIRNNMSKIRNNMQKKSEIICKKIRNNMQKNQK
jgi:hypothetical protein